MRKLLLVACAAVLVIWLTDVDGSRVYDMAARAARRVTLPFKIASLHLEEPDRKLVVPVEGVSARTVKNTWHAPRSGNRLHEGQDIFAKRGTPVRSATNGYVLSVGENVLGGKIVFVIGAGGRRYYYAHLDAHAPNIAAGDYVTPETILGYVGTTGNADGTPPHLHFGVYATDGALDPLPLLTDKG